MKTVDVLMVRIYITESSNLLYKIIDVLKNDVKVRGLSVFRAISGFGESGDHDSSLVDLSLNLPLSIEFFDDKTRIEKALRGIELMLKPEHIVIWEAKTYTNQE